MDNRKVTYREQYITENHDIIGSLFKKKNIFDHYFEIDKRDRISHASILSMYSFIRTCYKSKINQNIKITAFTHESKKVRKVDFIMTS